MICGFCKLDKPREEFGAPPSAKYEWFCKRCEANRQSIYKHGLTNDQKVEIAKAKGGCAICGHADPGSKGWNLDHDRDCCSGSKSCPKCRRGVLCGWCNKMLAYAFDRPQILSAAIEYLAAHASGTCDWHKPLACTPKLCAASSTDETEKTNAESLVHFERDRCVSDARELAAKFIPSRSGKC